MLNKLVRDKIVPDMEALGQNVVFRKLSDEEFLQELSKKLVEEAEEFKADKAEALKELADVLEVVEALAKEFGADFESLRSIQAERKAKRGGFSDRTYVGRLNLADDDPWADYYAKDPIKFPPIQ